MKISTQNPSQKFYMDYFLLCICTLLLLIGFVILTSASLHLGGKMVNGGGYPLKQLVHILVGIVVAVLICCLPLRYWKKSGLWLFIAGIALLAMVLVPGIGKEVNHSTRWISIAGVNIQVSEIIKFISVIYIASYADQRRDHILHSASSLIQPGILFLIASLLLLQEPNFGATVIIVAIAMGVIFLSGIPLKQFFPLLVFMLIASVLLVYFSAYRWTRVVGFIDPWADAQDSGFQLVQALIAFGRGGISGVGLGSGIQKLSYLPEVHTDFIFSVLAEELGLLGVLLVISLFLLLFYRAFMLAAKAEQMGEYFATFVAYGVGIWFGLQAFINMGVNMGMLPTKGATLPLISYGGSSMVTMCAAIALLFRVHSEITGKNTRPRASQQNTDR